MNRDLSATSALNLEPYWMPFTDNRRFKAKLAPPRADALYAGWEKAVARVRA